MPSLKDLKNRIASVKSTRKITKAMQMVAAAKLRRAQDAAETARPYAERFNAVMASLAGVRRRQRHRAAASARHGRGPGASAGRDDGRARPLRRLQRQHRQAGQAGARRRLSGRGQDGQDPDRRQEGPRCAAPRLRASSSSAMSTCRDVKRIGYADAQGIAQDVLERFDDGRVRRRDDLLLEVRERGDARSRPRSRSSPPMFEDAGGRRHRAPRRSTTTSRARRRSWPTCCRAASRRQIFAALLENAASEQGARMSAMDNATRNAGEMIDKLTIEYNRSRQAVITNELIEIISGAEAL